MRGESVFLVNESDVRALNIPGGDLMIFDERQAVLNHYSPAGELTGCDFYDTTDEEFNAYLRLKNELKKRATRPH